MGDTEDQIRESNTRFAGIRDEARTWLIGQLNAKGYASHLIGDAIATTIKDEATGMSAASNVYIRLLTRHVYSRKFEGLAVRVARSKHPLNYRKFTENWRELPWGKIIESHCLELRERLKSNLHCQARGEERARLELLAKKEVELPFKENYHNDEYLQGYERSRQPNGRYHVQVNCSNLTADQARTIRDYVIAANQFIDNAKIKPAPQAEPAL